MDSETDTKETFIQANLQTPSSQNVLGKTVAYKAGL